MGQELKQQKLFFQNRDENEEEDEDEEYLSQSLDFSKVTSRPTFDQNGFDKNVEITDTPTFDLMPEGYDENDLESLKEEFDDEDDLKEE